MNIAVLEVPIFAQIVTKLNSNYGINLLEDLTLESSILIDLISSCFLALSGSFVNALSVVLGEIKVFSSNLFVKNVDLLWWEILPILGHVRTHSLSMVKPPRWVEVWMEAGQTAILLLQEVFDG